MNEELQKLGIKSEQDLYEVLTESEEVDTLFSDIYGYITEECSMKDESFPGIINLAEYKGVYVVWIEDECPSFNGAPYFWKYEVFTKYEDAKQYFDNMKGKGIKPINERIKECICQTSDSKRIEIVMRSKPYCNMFDVYYKANLMIEHMRELDSNKINAEIQNYNLLEKQKEITILSIKKRMNRCTNQNKYVLEYCDACGETHSVEKHIRSVLQDRERSTLDIICEGGF